ncbi:hypothetical protein J7T55_001424 [Diaporthe amygdali]|uniref:uncharacterized protein n=1 Tax=Phomopsis amygdali TaxID=1214568 RepID=UPI0022FE208B|nr:uncharacterized protein J7T55_001424 [Diaporthe amygdali]KAJ0115017.1 hypothetical protein J7T55_001424 [Diaporthe amygdali]
MSPRKEKLRSYFNSHPGQPLRPILTSLNGDASWLMSFPCPAPLEQGNRLGTKRFYHFITDAWLKGPATLLSPWLVCIERTEPAAVSNGNEVDGLVREIEELAAVAQGTVLDEDPDAQLQQPLLDAILIKLHVIDHLNRPTLETFDRSIPVFATAQAAPTIRGWGHFDRVVETRDYKRYSGDTSIANNPSSTSDVPPEGLQGHWKSFHPGKPLPDWLSVFRLVGDRDLELATAIVWSHEDRESNDERNGKNMKNEFIIDTPHGIDIKTESIVAFFDGNVIHKSTTAEASERPEVVDKLECLAIFAGLKDSYALGMRSTIGVERSLQLWRKAEPRYWVRSHDSPLRYSGAIMRLLMTTDVPRTLEYGLEEEKKQMLKGGKVEDLRVPDLVKVRNGECLVLD